MRERERESVIRERERERVCDRQRESVIVERERERERDYYFSGEVDSGPRESIGIVVLSERGIDVER